MNSTTEKVRVSGKSLEEVIEKAADLLGTDIGSIEYEVLECGNKGGLFGIGAKDVVIDAYVSDGFDLSSLDNDNLLSDFLPTLLQKMGIPCEMKSSKENDAISVVMESPHASTIIGKKGETLLALQYLTNVVENRQRKNTEFLRYTLDIENYRHKREQALCYQAKTAANRVLKNGRSFIMDPLNPYERRIVHAYLQNIDGISSHSIGEEPNRKIVISKK